MPSTPTRSTLLKAALCTGLLAAGVAGCSAAPDAPPKTHSVATSASTDDSMAVDRLAAEVDEVGEQAFTARDYKPGTVRHIVVFRFASDVERAQREEVRSQYLALQASSTRDGEPYIVAMESGDQIAGEGAGFGFEQAYIVTFASQGDRNFFVGSPIVKDKTLVDLGHDRFKAMVGPLLDTRGALVFDYATDARLPG